MQRELRVFVITFSPVIREGDAAVLGKACVGLIART